CADAHVFGIGAVALTEADSNAFLADAEAGAGSAAAGALAAINVGQAGDALAGLPLAFDGGADLDDLAGEFVAHDAAAGQRLDRGRLGHVQVGAANAAVLNFEDEIGRPAFGVGNCLDNERFARFLEDGGAHSRIPTGLAWIAMKLTLARRYASVAAIR